MGTQPDTHGVFEERNILDEQVWISCIDGRVQHFGSGLIDTIYIIRHMFSLSHRFLSGLHTLT